MSPSLRISPSRLARWLAFGIWTAALGAALAAITALPILDSARESSRAGGVPGGDDGLIQGRQTLLSLVGPSVQRVPSQGSAWEERGGLGLIVLALAVIAPLLVKSPRVRFQAGVCVLLVVYAVGGAALLQGVPGFNMFRQPARMFGIAALPIAQLVGVAVNALVTKPGPLVEQRGLARFVVVALTLVIGLLVFSWGRLLRLEGYELALHPYWISLALTLPAALWLLGRDETWTAGAWLALLLVDVWALVLPYVETRPMADIYPVPESVRFLAEHANERGRVLDYDFYEAGLDEKQRQESPGIASPLGRGAPMALLHGLEPLRGYWPIDLLRYKEFLHFMADRDAPLVPLRDHLTFPVLKNLDVKNRPLLDLLGTRYILQPSAIAPPADCVKVLDDPAPRAFDTATTGMCTLSPYTLYENPHALPRAFVVFNAEPMPPREQALAKLKTTDFRRTVLLEGLEAPVHRDASARPVRIETYQPNRVVLDVAPGEAGYLVLTDPWSHGWNCMIDGAPAEILHANHAFRAVALPADARQVVFTLYSRSFALGCRISLAAAILAAALLTVVLIRKRIDRAARMYDS